MFQDGKLLEKKCWYCTTTTDEHFCASCDRIQVLDLTTSYFSFFKLPQKFHLDLNRLESSFYDLSRKFHPDFFSQASQEERRYSTERTSMLNDAYRILKDPLKRADYLLTLQGIKTVNQKSKTPPDLLAEIFELNEQIEELRDAKANGDKAKIDNLKSQVLETEEMLRERSKNLKEKLNKIFSQWDESLNNIPISEKETLLNQANDVIGQIKYVNNLLDDIEEEFDE